LGGGGGGGAWGGGARGGGPHPLPPLPTLRERGSEARQTNMEAAAGLGRWSTIRSLVGGGSMVGWGWAAAGADGAPRLRA
ncbi:MAG: hypothetical protein AMXMBFR80_13100, partial [Dehalococcoidia bacterium]